MVEDRYPWYSILHGIMVDRDIEEVEVRSGTGDRPLPPTEEDDNANDLDDEDDFDDDDDKEDGDGIIVDKTAALPPLESHIDKDDPERNNVRSATHSSPTPARQGRRSGSAGASYNAEGDGDAPRKKNKRQRIVEGVTGEYFENSVERMRIVQESKERRWEKEAGERAKDREMQRHLKERELELQTRRLDAEVAERRDQNMFMRELMRELLASRASSEYAPATRALHGRLQPTQPVGASAFAPPLDPALAPWQTRSSPPSLSRSDSV